MKTMPTMMVFGALGILGYYFWTTYQGTPEAISRPVTEATPGGVESYTVRGGDTLGRIATKFGMVYNNLLRLNPQFAPQGERNPDLIVPGESIRVK